MSDSYFTNKEHMIPHRVEKLIRWIPPINGIFKLNFDDYRINNISALEWVIRDFNEVIKMTESRHLGNTSIISVEYMALSDGIVTLKCIDFFKFKN